MAQAVTDIAIIGAGPYGLSLAAHLNGGAATFRIFGSPMQTWREHMPKGMTLKSDGFASNLADPHDRMTLEAFCKAHDLPYHPMIPPTLAVFVDYALDFQRRLVPMIEPIDVMRVEPDAEGFKLTLASGEHVLCRQLVLAVGISHFGTLPPIVADLPPSLASHAAAQYDPAAFTGKSVAIIGAGSSAVELAVLIHEAGGHPRLIARSPDVRFFSGPPGAKRSLWRRIRHPKSGLGPGLRSRLLTDLPDVFRVLPAERREAIATTHLGPVSAFHLMARLFDKVPVFLSTQVGKVETVGGRARLHLHNRSGAMTTIDVDHVIAATGYPAALARWTFLDPSLREAIDIEFNNPKLTRNFETTARGLYVVGLSSAISFGPLCRFVYGARFTARRLSRHLQRTAPRA